MKLRIAITSLPFIGLLVGIHFANRATPYVLGLPFIVFYVAFWVVMCAVLMGLLTWLDDRAERKARDTSAPDAGRDAV